MLPVSVLEEFSGKEVTLLLDGRYVQYSTYHSGGSVSSLEAIAQISQEQNPASEFLRVDSITYNLYENRKEEFGKGVIQKKYIIGIFEPVEKTE